MPHLLHIDAHVHYYPSYPLGDFLHAAARNLPRTNPVDTRVLALAERDDCHFFQALAQDELPLPPDFRIVAYDPQGAIKIRHIPAHSDFWIAAGRQINTAEKVEICSLLSDALIPSRLSLPETLATIRAADAIPLLNFAPGKWLFKRGKLLEKTVKSLAPSAPFLFADTTLRPTLLWPTPSLIRLARRLRRPVLAGSDPLPFAAEATMPATYYATLDVPPPPDPASLVPYLRSLLTSPSLPPATLAGRRSSPPAVLSRLYHNARSKKT